MSLSTTPTRSGGPGRLTVDPLTGGVQERLGSLPEALEPAELASNFTTTALHYRGAFSHKRLLVDSNLGWSHQTRSLQSSELDEEVRVDRYQANIQATYLLHLAGSHELKAGADAELRASEQPLRSTSHFFGGFVQDSWALSNRVTLNAGVRFDTWSLDDGQHAPVRSRPLSPRLGVAVAPWAEDKMKLFAHYAEYQAPVLLRSRGSTAAVPEVVLPAAREWGAGAELAVLYSNRLGASYTHRDLGPASGETPERTYDAVTVSLSRPFTDDWLAEVSYTWSRLKGSELEPWQAEFDVGGPAGDGTGLLPYDRTHFIKAFGSRDFSLSREVKVSLSLSYRGSSGVPLARLESGSAERTPWVHAIDPRVRLEYRLGRESKVSFELDVFNLLNAQEVTRAGEDGREGAAYQAPRQVRLGARYTF